MIFEPILLCAGKQDNIKTADKNRTPAEYRVNFQNPSKYRIIPYYLDLNIGDIIRVTKNDGSESHIRIVEVKAESKQYSCPRTRVTLDIDGQKHFAYCGMVNSRKGGIGPIEVAGVNIGVDITKLVFSKIRKKSRLNSYDNFKLSKDVRLVIWDGSKRIMKNAIESFIINQLAWTRNKFGNWLHRTSYGIHNAIDIFASKNGVPEEVRSPVNGIIYRVYNKDADSDSKSQMKSINIYSDDVVGPGDEKILFRLMHFSEILVSNGDHVKKGQVIGLTGHTGFNASIGDHLHFEIRLNPSLFGQQFNNNLFYSIPVNPYYYLLEWWEDFLRAKQKAET